MKNSKNSLILFQFKIRDFYLAQKSHTFFLFNSNAKPAFTHDHVQSQKDFQLVLKNTKVNHDVTYV